MRGCVGASEAVQMAASVDTSLRHRAGPRILALGAGESFLIVPASSVVPATAHHWAAHLYL